MQLLLPSAGKVLEWGDRVATWYLREHDMRGYVPGKGWAHAVAHGADAIGVLGQSPHFAANELTVLLDVLADRLLLTDPGCCLRRRARPDGAGHDAGPAPQRGQPQGARAVDRPDRRRAPARCGSTGDRDPFLDSRQRQAFLRALLPAAQPRPADPPGVRPDLILVLVEALRGTNPHYLGPHHPA